MTEQPSEWMNPIDLAFAKRVSTEIADAGLSEVAFAELLPRPLRRQTTVNRIRRGLRRVTVGEAFILSSVLGFPLSDFQPPLGCQKCYGAPPEGFTCNACGAA